MTRARSPLSTALLIASAGSVPRFADEQITAALRKLPRAGGTDSSAADIGVGTVSGDAGIVGVTLRREGRKNKPAGECSGWSKSIKSRCYQRDKDGFYHCHTINNPFYARVITNGGMGRWEVNFAYPVGLRSNQLRV